MDYSGLRSLLETHPTWPGVDDATLTAWVNDSGAVARDRPAIDATEILDECLRESTEWLALTDAERDTVLGILNIYGSVPTAAGTPARAALIAILGTATKAALAALIPETVSRAVDAGLGVVRQGDVEYARTL